MRLTLDSTGTLLASLALSLQIGVCALGGRLCYRAAPVAVAEAEACGGGCCGEQDDDQDRSPGSGWVATNIPPAPVESDCCLEQAEEYLLQTAGHVKLHLPSTTGVVATASIAMTWISTESTRPQPPPLPPPELRLVRATILLL